MRYEGGRGRPGRKGGEGETQSTRQEPDATALSGRAVADGARRVRVGGEKDRKASVHRARACGAGRCCVSLIFRARG